MKKILFGCTLVLCCIGCDKEELVVDDNLIGLWESQIPLEINVTEPNYSIIHHSEGIDTIFVGSYEDNSELSFEFTYPNNYIIFSNTNYPILGEISTGTFFNEDGKIYFNGNFKHQFYNTNWERIGALNIDNVDFHCSYNLSNSQLIISEISISTSFEIDTEFNFQGGEETIYSTNSTLEFMINNYPLWLDNRVYNKEN